MKNRLWIIVSLVVITILSLVLLGLKNKVSAPIIKIANPSISKLLNLAKSQEERGDLAGARDAYQTLIKHYPNYRDVNNWQGRVEEINIKLIFSTAAFPGSTLYEIQPGDTLTKIAKEFNTTVDLITKANGLEGSVIRPGKKIKVQTLGFSVLVDKSQNALMLKSGDEIIKTYIVSTGANNSTPAGTFKIVNKLIQPTWFKTGAVVPPNSPDNMLGSRWMGLDVPGYGIHGTTEPNNLGKQITNGCVRMSNSDVEELYILLPAGTEVTIVD